MIKITAFNVYEAAIENAVWNDIEVTIDYIEKYAENAMNITIERSVAVTIFGAYEKWYKEDWKEQASADFFYHNIKEPLSKIEA